MQFFQVGHHADDLGEQGAIIQQKLAGAVLLRDEEGPSHQDPMAAGMGGAPPQGGAVQQGLPAGVSGGDMTLGQAFMQARRQLMGGMSAGDGM